MFDHHIWCICSDGDIEEGVSHEVELARRGTRSSATSSLIYDDNEISIEDDTRIAKSEDVAARYAAYGWHVQTVDWRTGDPDEGDYHEDVEALYDAILAAQAETDRPSFIALRTIIGWPAPNKQNTGKIHGSALGADEVAATKEILGFDPGADFAVDDEGARARPRGAGARPGGARRVGAGVRGLGRRPTRSARRCSTGWPARTLPDGLDRRAAGSSRRTPRASPPGPPPARC